MLKGVWMRISVIAFVCALSVTAHAMADPKRHVNVLPGDLTAGLESLAKQSGAELIYSSDQVAGLHTHGVSGDFSAKDAVTKLLEGTKLEVRTDEATGAMLIAPPVATVGSGNPATPDAVPHDADASTKEVGKKSSQDFRVAELDQTNTGPSVAQQDVQQEKKSILEEVLVTGTHINDVAPVGSTVHTLTQEDIARSGYTTIAELLQALPENFRGGAAGASQDGYLGSGTLSGYNVDGGSGVNLRGLGSSATLVLIDGHRAAPSGSGYFVDISAIPVSAIDHIDVLADGASAIYGSDAVAGVVNIVLKRKTEGLEAGLRYGASTEGGGDLKGLNLQWGHDWRSGGITAGADLSRQNQLYASARDFTATVPGPTSIFPSYGQVALTGAGQQALTDELEFHADAQYSRKTSTLYQGAGAPTVYQYDNIGEQWGGSLGLKYQLPIAWTVGYDFSEGDKATPTDVAVGAYVPGASPPTPYSTTKTESRFSDHEISASGRVLHLPAGDVGLAVGVSYRAESYSLNGFEYSGATTTAENVDRHVVAEYAELRLPVLSESNAVPGFRELTLSAAIRHDRYSDFGDTTNPKFGLSWVPIDSLKLRAAYSRSFRAPATGAELANSQVGTIGAELVGFPGPAESANVPVLILLGSAPNLQPETARNWTTGLDFLPVNVPGLKLALDYYNIVYSNQIATPPLNYDPVNDPAITSVVTRQSPATLQGIVNAVVAAGNPYFDFTNGAFGPDPLSHAMWLYDYRSANLAKTSTSGVDLSVRYIATITTSQFDTNLALTYIDEYRSDVTPTSPEVNLANTVGYPAKLRFRGQETWIHGAARATVALNVVGSYMDTSAPQTAPRSVGSYITTDVVFFYDLSALEPQSMHDFNVTLSAINLFDRAPPYVVEGSPDVTGVHYDVANASPLGRFVSLSLSKRW
jgi:outer membrane receptor protein involved in Fe transport